MESSEALQEQFSPAIVYVFFSLWLTLVVCLFWWFLFRFETVWVSFEGQNLPDMIEPNGAWQVVHFVDEACPCSKFSEPHIAELEATWAPQGVRFKSVQAGNELELDQSLLAEIPASPSVAVWDAAGELNYFGPYTSGVLCGQGEDLLAQVLNNPTQGQRISQEAVGCFCSWPKGQT